MKQLLFLLLLISSLCFGQNFKTTLGTTTPWPKPGLEALPKGYTLDTSKYYPLIFFIGGTGQANDVNTLDDYGPSKLVADGVEIPAIVVSIAPGLYPPVSYINSVLEELYKKYRIDRNKIILTGLSMGGQIINQYVSVPGYGSKIAAVYSLQGVQVQAQPMADNFTGKWWSVEGGHPDEYRGGDKIAAAMNTKRPGSAELTVIPQGKPGYTHCCWNSMYAPDFKNKAGQTWLEWSLGQSASVVVPPVVVPPVFLPIFVKEVITINIFSDGHSETSTKKL